MELLDETLRAGGCQCGAVRYTARGILDNPHVCHCRMCQRATGNFFAPLVGVPNDRLDWQGSPATFESSAGIERGFCAAGGTPLFYRRVEAAHTSLMIGTFDAPETVPLAYEFSIETRTPQVGQLFHLEEYRLDEIMADALEQVAQTNRQYRP